MLSMKIAITGKGGVGKTTVTSLLAWAYARDGRDVIAIDANPDANLASALGFEKEQVEQIIPISELNELIQERTGASSDTYGGLFKLNPKVDDIPEKYSIQKDGIRLLIMGTVKKGGGGCLCPESAMIKSLLSHLMFKRTEVVLMDMDAGIENLGRGTAGAMDALIIVVEPGQRSFQTAYSIQKLAADLGIKRCCVIGSKTRFDSDQQFISDHLKSFEILGFINYNPEIAMADRLGTNVYESAPQSISSIKKIQERLEQIKGNGK